jgi:inner membrane protein
MMATSHISFAATLWWLYCLIMGYSITGFHTLVAAIGGLMPDLDHPKSALGRRLPFISLPLSSLFGHRGFTHSLVMVVVMFVGLAYVTKYPDYSMGRWMVTPLCVGYLSHILGDAFTPSGVPLFYPKKTTYSLNLFKTRSPLETVFVGTFTLSVFIFGGIYNHLVAQLSNGLLLWQNLISM